jgi:hypothetical protein
MGADGPVETFFVVASTDLERSAIMTARIRGQLERVPGVNAKGALTLTVVPVDIPSADAGGPLENQVQAVAARISSMIVQSMSGKLKFLAGVEDRNSD